MPNEEFYRNLYSKYAPNVTGEELDKKLKNAHDMGANRFIHAFYQKYTGKGPDQKQINYINTRLEQPKRTTTNKSIKHATIDQMKKDNSWLQTEGDFNKKMNEHYKGTGVTFQDAIGGKDAFTMYDAATDETSEPIRIPGFFGESHHEGYGIKSWENVDAKIKEFFNRDKKISSEFKKAKEKTTNVIAQNLESEEFLTNLLGEDFDWEYIQKEARGGKSGTGEENDYEKVLKALKEKVGEFGPGFLGLTEEDFTATGEFAAMSEQAVEEVVKNAVTKKFEKDRDNKVEEAATTLASTITEENTTETKIDEANKAHKILTLTEEGKALHIGVEKLNALEPGTKEYTDQEEANKLLRKKYNKWYEWNAANQLIDPITGASINPEAPEAATAISITKEDLDKTENKIKLTYGENVEQGFKVNGRKKWLSDKQGEQEYDVTINDPQAVAIFQKLGYKVKGSNENGYEMVIKKKHLARYYDATVKSDGFTYAPSLVGSMQVAPEDREVVGDGYFNVGMKAGRAGLYGIEDFKTDVGYFGLTEKVGEQEVRSSSLFHDLTTRTDEYEEGVDLSKAFKRSLKDYRDDRFNIIKEGRVLTKMHLLNIDPAARKTFLPERGAELVVEGFKGIFGGSQVDTDVMTSGREERDILEGIANNSNIKLTTTQEDRIKRSGAYRVYEGVTGFVPAIAEFALIDLAIKKGVGIIPGAAKLVSKLGKGNILQKSLYHTGGIIKEELKMKQAFDEHYHLGGGTGFYAVGNLIPNFKSGYALLNTFMNANKSGVGGALSVQAAANLEALARDVAGKESYQTWIKENYADLGLTTEDFIVDYLVFASVGAKGWAFGGGKNWKNNFKTTGRLEKLEGELFEKIPIYENALKNMEATGRGQSKEFLETTEKLNKTKELAYGVHAKLEGIYDMNDWQDPEKATKMMERQDRNIKAVFGKDVSLKAVNSRKDKDGNELFEFEDSAAEFSKDGKNILVDVNRVQPGKIPHEVFHLTMKKLFDNNPDLMNRFKATIESSFQGKIFSNVAIRDNKGELTGEKRSMSIEELVMNEHGHQKNFDNLKANEFLAYTAEILSNPRHYSKFVAKGTWNKIKADLNKFTNRHMGTSVIESGTKQDLIDFMANFSRSVMAGNLTRKQVNMFKKMKDGKVFAEAIEADSRTEQRKNEEASDEYLKSTVASKSVELSDKTQKVYESIVKGKEDAKLDRAIDQMIVPSKKKDSVAGEHFDDIIYELIKNLKPEVYRNPDQRYTLALDMVYDISRGTGVKNRGIKGIIKDYHNRQDFITRTVKKEDGTTKKVRDVFDSEGNKKLTEKKIDSLENKYDAKFGTPEFIEQALAEGYKGKQNLTKTVMQQLALRIHDMKRDAIDQESDVSGLGFTESVEGMKEYGKELVDPDEKPFEFKSREEINREARGKKKINPLDYVPPKDLLSIRKNTTDFLTSTKALIDLRPAMLAKAILPKTKLIIEKQFGRYKEVEDKDGNITLEKVVKKDYYDISKELFETKEREIYEMFLPETRDRYTSETTNAAKSAFRGVYESKGEFTFAELNKGIAKEILTDSQKAEGRDKMTKKPYRKGILNEIIFKGEKKTHHTKMDYLMPHGAFTLSRKVVDMQLNNPRFVKLLKKMNPGVYEGLQFDKVLNSVRENLRGTTPETLASKNVKLLVDQFAEKIRKGQNARAAMLEVIANNEDLKPYKKQIMEDMKLGLDDFATTGELFMKVGESGRLLKMIKGKAAKPIIFDGKFAGKEGNSVYGELNKIMDQLAKEGIVDKDLLNINKGKSAREKDVDFSREYVEEFLPEIFNTFDVRLLNMKGPDRGGLGKTMGYGEQRFGFRELVDHVSSEKIKGYKFNESTGKWHGKRYKIFDAEMRNGIFEGLEGIKEVNPKTGKPLTDKQFAKKFFDPKYVKVNDNTVVQKIVDDALALPKFQNAVNPKNVSTRKKLTNYVKKQLSPDGKVSGYEKMLKANEGMLEYISEKLYDHVNNAAKSGKKGAFENAINNVSYLLQIQTNLGGGWFRGLASHNATTLKRSGSLDLALSKRYRSEHEFQLVNFTGNLLLNTLTHSGNKTKFKNDMKPLVREFKQSIISKELQEKIDNAESGGTTSNIYAEKGMTTDVMAKANFLLDRQIMESIVDLKTGKTYAEIIDGRLQSGAGYKALKVASEKANLPSKNVTLTEMVRNMKTRDEALAKGRKRKKKPRGMSTFDFDETVGVSENYIFATKGKETKKIASHEWPVVGEQLRNEGWKMDFTDFNKVTKGKPGPLMEKLKNQIKKFGNENVFILTARDHKSAKAIHEWLKNEGVNLPLENITGLGNSTGEAKALWMLEKFAEGYNDMYFVDDAMSNVKAVKDVLSQLDIKSKVQQALASKNVDLEINNIMEHSLGVESGKRFSKAEGKVRGKDIKRRRIIMPDSAADMELLIEPLLGKGKKGIENKKWFDKNFYKPWERGSNNLNTARQAILNDYLSLRKQNKDVVKQLDKEVEGTNFTNDQAMRVYIWNKNGFKIPDLVPATEAKLVEHIKNNPKLQSYADRVATLTKIETGLKQPNAEWWAETLASEVSETGRTVDRSKYIADWIEAKNEIFSEANLNKMESRLGSRWRSDIEDMFNRMETGRTRGRDMGRIGNKVMNYLNGSVGAIMNLNTRSATLQLISSVNFINHAENNPLAAARAFANQPQYWKDFMKIMNSDMLLQRRAGLKINVTEAELAAAVDGKGSKAKRALAWILKQGYIPTKVADSFAIASGGATYLRNRIRMYEKQGLETKEAESKAWIDFQAIAEKTQQSSRADLLSRQQTSFEGRLILPFSNTPMQMNRIMMKEMLDLSKGRYEGSFGENSFTNKMSKITYYGAIQSLIFAGLQSGLFALMANGGDDEMIAKKKIRTVNTMTDSFLRGMGISGAVASGVKNAVLKFLEQNEKGFNADYAEVGEALLNISPTIGSKVSKMDAAGNTYNYNKKEILEKGLSLDNTKAIEAGAQTIEAITNVPIHRVIRKTQNMQGALDKKNEDWQRLMMLLGWSKWDVGIIEKKKKKKKKKKRKARYY